MATKFRGETRKFLRISCLAEGKVAQLIFLLSLLNNLFGILALSAGFNYSVFSLCVSSTAPHLLASTIPCLAEVSWLISTFSYSGLPNNLFGFLALPAGFKYSAFYLWCPTQLLLFPRFYKWQMPRGLHTIQHFVRAARSGSLY